MNWQTYRMVSFAIAASFSVCSSQALEPAPPAVSTTAPINSSSSGENTAAETEVAVPSGTPIRLIEGGEILGLSAPVGKMVDFKVVNDVIVDGWVVIQAGAPAQGHVTESRPMRMSMNPFANLSGQQMPYLTIALDWVTCADGRKLHVEGILATKKSKVGVGDMMMGKIPDISTSTITPGAAVDVTTSGAGKVFAKIRKSSASKGDFAN